MELSYNGKNSDKLILLFLGWSCDESTLKDFSVDGYDILYIFDYKDMNINLNSITESYEHIYVIGWSFGVWAASIVCKSIENIKLSIAINGTPIPIDNQFGIPDKIFNYTLRKIESEGIDTFNNRMCDGDFKGFNKSQRDFKEQVDELRLLGAHSKEQINEGFKWNNAIIGSKDVIFPPKNMQSYWQEKCNITPTTITAPHFCFNQIGGLIINLLKLQL